MVMNKQKQVFGVVENVEENKDYTGIKTETAEVTVDNINRVIKADVFFEGMLGETSKTAYPGHLGAQTRNLVIKNKDAIEQETNRALDAEDNLYEYIEDVEWSIAIEDSKIKEKLYAETDRAKAAEKLLDSSITTLSQDTAKSFDNVDKNIENLSDHLNDEVDKLNTLIVNTSNKLSENIKTLEEDTSNKLNDMENNISQDIKQLQQTIEEEIQSSIDDLKDADNEILQNISDLKTQLSSKDTLIIRSIEELQENVNNSDEQIRSDISNTAKNLTEQISLVEENTNIKINTIEKNISTIESDYAEKTYVYEKLVEFTKLSKQIVEKVDIELNKVLIEGSYETPIDGVLYLVNNQDVSGPDFYEEYTTIQGQLTLIGDTSISLEGYAKLTDIPDVSSFIAEIPEEYVTDTELDSRGFYTQKDVKLLLNDIEFIDGGTSASLNI